VIRVLTWNLWWQFGPWRQREAAIASVVVDLQPDVLLLQEVWSDGDDSSAARLAGHLGYHHALTDDPSARRRDGKPGFHNAIVSRWPLHEVTTHPLPGPHGRMGVRRALSAAVQPSGGDRWRFVSLHLDYQFDASALRQRQCETLLHLVAGLRGDPEREPPVVIGGDFNAPPDSDEIRLLTGRRAMPLPGVVLSDSWEHVGDGPGATWRADNPYQAGTTWPNRRLDYVFVSWPRPKPLGNPTRAALVGVGPVDGVVPSDHAGVVVDLVDSRPVTT
jgi:endonuclease/exonuclease/phosphatase family metal-dependent hydrolase